MQFPVNCADVVEVAAAGMHELKTVLFQDLHNVSVGPVVEALRHDYTVATP